MWNETLITAAVVLIGGGFVGYCFWRARRERIPTPPWTAGLDGPPVPLGDGPKVERIRPTRIPSGRTQHPRAREWPVPEYDPMGLHDFKASGGAIFNPEGRRLLPEHFEDLIGR